MTASPVQSALSRRERIWPAVLASAAAHLVLVGWAVVRQPSPTIDLEQKPIVARLVRLGEKKPEQWLPRKEAPPPAPAAAPATPAPAPVAAAARAAPSTKGKAPPQPAAPASAAPGTGQSLSSILNKVRREAVAEKRYGDPGGAADGDSDQAAEDPYLAQIHRALRAHYVAPVTIPERERLYLEASVTLWIEPDGRITRWRQEKSSGNPTFDAAVERTLRLTIRVPAPPEPMRDALRRNGISLVFQARQS